MNESFLKLKSPQLRVPENRPKVSLKGLVLGFHFAQVSPVAAHPLLQIFTLFFRYRHFAAVVHFVRPAPRVLVVKAGCYWVFLHKDLS